MNDLTPEAFALFRAGRTALRPGAPDRERVYQSLIGAIGEPIVLHGTRRDTSHDFDVEMNALGEQLAAMAVRSREQLHVRN
jgi:hypothetical protein